MSYRKEIYSDVANSQTVVFHLFDPEIANNNSTAEEYFVQIRDITGKLCDYAVRASNDWKSEPIPIDSSKKIFFDLVVKENCAGWIYDGKQDRVILSRSQTYFLHTFSDNRSKTWHLYIMLTDSSLPPFTKQLTKHMNSIVAEVMANQYSEIVGNQKFLIRLCDFFCSLNLQHPKLQHTRTQYSSTAEWILVTLRNFLKNTVKVDSNHSILTAALLGYVHQSLNVNLLVTEKYSDFRFSSILSELPDEIKLMKMLKTQLLDFTNRIRLGIGLMIKHESTFTRYHTWIKLFCSENYLKEIKDYADECVAPFNPESEPMIFHLLETLNSNKSRTLSPFSPLFYAVSTPECQQDILEYYFKRSYNFETFKDFVTNYRYPIEDFIRISGHIINHVVPQLSFHNGARADSPSILKEKMINIILTSPFESVIKLPREIIENFLINEGDIKEMFTERIKNLSYTFSYQFTELKGLRLFLDRPLIEAFRPDSNLIDDICLVWMQRNLQMSNSHHSVRSVYELLSQVMQTHHSALMASHSRDHNARLKRFLDIAETNLKPFLDNDWALISSITEVSNLIENLNVSQEVKDTLFHHALKIASVAVKRYIKDESTYIKIWTALNTPSKIQGEVRSIILNCFWEEFRNKTSESNFFLFDYCRLIKTIVATSNDSSTFPQLKKVFDYAVELLNSIADGAMTVDNYLKLTKYLGVLEWHEALHELAETFQIKTITSGYFQQTKASIDTFVEDISLMRQLLERIRRSIQCLFEVDPITSGARMEKFMPYLDRCKTMEESIGTLTIKDIRLGEIWGITAPFKTMSKDLVFLQKSMVFNSNLDMDLLNIPSNINLDADYIPYLLNSISRTVGVMNAFFSNLHSPHSVLIIDALKIWPTNVNWEVEIEALDNIFFRSNLTAVKLGSHLLQNLSVAHQYTEIYAPAILTTSKQFVCIGGEADPVIQICENIQQLTKTSSLQNLSDVIDELDIVLKKYNNVRNTILSIIVELSKAKDLIAFLRDVRNEQGLNLIDVVEDNADSLLRAETISEFDVLREFMKPMLADGITFQNWMDLLFKSLQGEKRESDRDKIPSKIHSCRVQVHSLQEVWKSISNREKSTKDLTAQMLRTESRAVVKFVKRKQNNSFQMMVEWIAPDGTIDKRDATSLEELRSRSLLIVNSAIAAQSSNSEFVSDDSKRSQDCLQMFIEMTECAITASTLLTELLSFGHFDFNVMTIEKPFDLSSLTASVEELTIAKAEWEHSLKSLRSEKEYINYYFSNQFWILEDFFKGMPINSQDRRKVEALLRYVGSDMSMRDVPIFDATQRVNEKTMSASERLKRLAFHLEDKVFPHLKSDNIGENPFLNDVTQSTYLTQSTYSTDEDLLPNLLSLFSDGNFVRHQILLCEDVMSFQEITTFLMRVAALISEIRAAVRNKHFSNRNSLHLLLRNNVDSCTDGKVSTKLLDIISEQKIKEMVVAKSSKVKVVSSSHAGFGKTEYIKQSADNENKRVIRINIHDDISRQELLEKILEVTLERYQALHLDLATISKHNDINTALFELLYLGISQIDTLVVHLPIKLTYCYIEYGNMTQVSNTVDAIRYFQNHHIETWSMSQFIIDGDIQSNIQIVANNLLSCEQGSLATAEVSINALNERTCQRLFKMYFFDHFQENQQLPSINVFIIFLEVLASQLKCFNNSSHYKLQVLAYSKSKPSIRTAIVESLVECSKAFAARSVASVRTKQKLNIGLKSQPSSHEGAEQDGIVRWDEDNQLMVAISPSGLRVLYRSLSRFCADKKELHDWITSQVGQLRDYFTLSSEELRGELSKFVGRSSMYTEREDYVLTPDNFLKGVMMLVRVTSRLPVIIMGEAGCGKTSLIRFMAGFANATLFVKNIHAGLSQVDIATDVKKAIINHDEMVQAQFDEKKKQSFMPYLWIFLDEINTCSELGFINSLICHRLLFGHRVPDHVIFFAACNPYSKKTKSAFIDVVGLSAIKKTGKTETDDLVYRVKPIPDTMLCYIWDFGSLSQKDEMLYIESMMSSLAQKLQSAPNAVNVLSNLVAGSQSFMRKLYGASAVSMRDVRRVKILVEWFISNKRHRPTLAKKQKAPKTIFSRFIPSFTTSQAKNDSVPIEFCCMILALCHCYRCRLAIDELRLEYDAYIANIFKQMSLSELDAIWIKFEILKEQEDYLNRMKLDEGIALNESLLENVYVLLICILNKIPVFLVGKPGSSKSLSMSLIASNLRGKDSADEFFKLLPQIKVISYQGSESSTSEGIIKVFEKANAYASSRSKEMQGSGTSSIIPVVLLDEVGLAEISPSNPLKVLHSRLETEDDKPLNVAVVGISNWTLDASKMSRAIQLSRPEPLVRDLQKTGIKIFESIIPILDADIRDIITELSDSYLQFYNKQSLDSKYLNFHGLRDFYSACKELGKIYKERGKINSEHIVTCIRRNFGGLPDTPSYSLSNSAFKPFFQKFNSQYNELTVKELIERNLRDKDSRHLMLITKGNSILNIMADLLSQAGILHSRVMIGSKMKGDLSEHYRYRILSEIILSMEKGESLAMKDFDISGIYGPLYAMLNQSYVTVAGKRNCRIALGAYSNPMCHVHDNFKCVVLVEDSTVHKLDAPFLNRFEKQNIQFTALLSPRQKLVYDDILQWVERFTKLRNNEQSEFTVQDTFTGFCEGTVSSMVFVLTANKDNWKNEEIINESKSKLLRIASCHGVVRSLLSVEAQSNPSEVDQLFAEYFKDNIHINLKQFLESKSTQDPFISTKSFLTTNSSYYNFNLNSFGIDPDSVTVVMLSSFETETTLSGFLKAFVNGINFTSSTLIIQCEAQMDSDKLLLAKNLIDREVHVNFYEPTSPSSAKKVNRRCDFILLVHEESDRAISAENTFETYYAFNWDYCHIDDLGQLEDSWVKIFETIYNKLPIIDYISQTVDLFDEILVAELITAFRSLKYSKGGARILKDICNTISQNSPGLKSLLKEKIMQYIRANSNGSKGVHWIVQIAQQREGLAFSSASLISAVDNSIRKLIQEPLIKSIYVLEKHLALDCYLGVKDEEITTGQRDIFLHHPALDLTLIPPPRGNECLVIESFPIRGLLFPFSALINGQVSTIKADYTNNTISKNLCSIKIKAVLQNAAQLCENGLDINKLYDSAYCKDVVKLFAKENCDDSLLESFIDISSHLIQLPVESTSETTTISSEILATYLFLWSHEELLTNISELMSRCKGLHLADNYHSLTYIIKTLAVDFCRQQWTPLPPAISPICQDPFNVDNLVRWSTDADKWIPKLIRTCELVGFDYYDIECNFMSSAADPNDIEGEFGIFPAFAGLFVMQDLSLLLSELMQSGNIVPTFLSLEALSKMDAKFLDTVVEYLFRAIDIIPTKSTVIVSIMHQIVDRFLTIARVTVAIQIQTSNLEQSGYSNIDFYSAIIQSEVYEVIGNILNYSKKNPPITCKHIVADVIWMLQESISKFEETSDMQTLEFFEHWDKIQDQHAVWSFISDFESIFKSTKGSNLEAMMVDMIYDGWYTAINELMKNDLNYILGLFENIVKRVKTECDTLPVVQRIYGFTVVRVVLEAAASWLISENSTNLELEEFKPKLEAAIGSRTNNKEFNNISNILCNYLLKATHLSLCDLRRRCSEGGDIAGKIPWIVNFYKSDAQNSLQVFYMNPFKSTPRIEEACSAWEKLFYISPSYEECTALVNNNTGISALQRMSFLNRCTTSRPVKSASSNGLIITHMNNCALQKYEIDLVDEIVNRFPNLPQDSDLFSEEKISILSFIVAIATSTSTTLLNGPFGSYARRPDSLVNSYVLAAQSNSRSNVITSFKMLQSHKNKISETVGFVFPDKSPDRYYTERELSIESYRILSMLVHISVLVGLLTRTADYVPILKVNHASEGVQKCWTSIVDSWTVLCSTLVQKNKSQFLCALIHRIIEDLSNANGTATLLSTVPNSSRLRNEWESAFANLCWKRIENASANGSAEFLSMIDRDDTLSLFERELYEIGSVDDVEDDNDDVFNEAKMEKNVKGLKQLSKYFRLTRHPSFEDLLTAFSRDVNHASKYPIISIYLKYRRLLSSVKDILPLLQWTNNVRRLMNFQIDLNNAKSVKDLLLQCENNPSLASEITPEKFQKFADAWNKYYAIEDFVTDRSTLEGQEVKLFQMNNSISILYSCIRLRNEGRLVAYMCQTLALLQNLFLTECHQALKINAPQKLMQSVTQKDVVVYDENEFWRKVSKDVRSKLHMGCGHEFEFDWNQVQKVIGDTLVTGKCTIELNIHFESKFEEYRFKHEIFAASERNLFYVINEVVTQVTIEDRAAILLDKFVRDQSEVEYNTLPALEALLYVLKQQKRSEVLTTNMVDFAESYLDTVTAAQFLMYRKVQSPISKLNLCHVEEFYKILEDTVSSVILNHLDIRYVSMELSIEQKETASAFLVPHIGGLEKLESVLRRFAIRYLRGRGNNTSELSLNPSDGLIMYIDYFRWPNGVDMHTDTVISALSRFTIGHVAVLLSYLQAEIKKRDDDIQPPQQDANIPKKNKPEEPKVITKTRVKFPKPTPKR